MALEEDELFRKLKSFARKSLLLMTKLTRSDLKEAEKIAEETYKKIVINKVDEKQEMQIFFERLRDI